MSAHSHCWLSHGLFWLIRFHWLSTHSFAYALSMSVLHDSCTVEYFWQRPLQSTQKINYLLCSFVSGKEKSTLYWPYSTEINFLFTPIPRCSCMSSCTTLHVVLQGTCLVLALPPTACDFRECLDIFTPAKGKKDHWGVDGGIACPRPEHS